MATSSGRLGCVVGPERRCGQPRGAHRTFRARADTVPVRPVEGRTFGGHGGSRRRWHLHLYPAPRGAPVAASHRFRIHSDETASGKVLADAHDPDGDPIRLHPFNVKAGAMTEEGGLVRIDADGSFNNRPANRRPVAVDDQFTIRPNGPCTTPCHLPGARARAPAFWRAVRLLRG